MLPLLFLLPLLSLAVAEPCTPERRLQRKAWHTLSSEEKADYLRAEVCLHELPSQTGREAAFTRYDDLITVHQVQSAWVHWDGFFLAFHRLHMHAHETLLREECGYKGAQPYWDESGEAGRFSSSEIFDPEIGFGGDGVGRQRCVEDGPFAKYELTVGPGRTNRPHCLSRMISDAASRSSALSNVTECLEMPTYADAWPCIELWPHAGGHGGVGGEMVDPISSPGDPLFYLHHSFLDRVWWLWQKRDLPKRLTDIAGATTPNGNVPVTMNSMMDMFGVVPNATVGDVMDIGGERLCFDYIDP